jgi:hypothetical protein
MTKKIRKKPTVPLCLSPHKWGDFIPYGNNSLIKRCDNCPAILTKKEFLKMKKEPIKIAQRIVDLKNNHIDLFWS